MSVGCDEGRFIFPEEFRLRTLGEASYDVSSAAQHMVAVLCSTYKCIELLAAIARGDHYRLAPRFAYGVEELVCEYVE